MEKQLLPSGFYDLLPPEARQETALINHCLNQFVSFGYEQVSLPLLEFEDSLLSGSGAAMSHQIFRVMDPLSHKMMGFRPDITLQIARIASSRLADAPRPLRLCYAGPVLQVAAEKLQTDRQVTQVGAELFGSDQVAADAEIILLAAETLTGMGMHNISVDLNLPGLVKLLLEGETLSADQLDDVHDAIARKDASRLAMLKPETRSLLSALMDAAGPTKDILRSIRQLPLPDAAVAQFKNLQAIITEVTRQNPELRLTVDPVEKRGFEYHSGVSFSLFAQGVKTEIGRGGRYMIPRNQGFETAVGFTLYIHILQNAAPAQVQGKKLFLPFGTAPETGAKLRADGYITLQALDGKADAKTEAKRLGCGYILDGSNVKAL